MSLLESFLFLQLFCLYIICNFNIFSSIPLLALFYRTVKYDLAISVYQLIQNRFIFKHCRIPKKRINLRYLQYLKLGRACRSLHIHSCLINYNNTFTQIFYHISLYMLSYSLAFHKSVHVITSHWPFYAFSLKNTVIVPVSMPSLIIGSQ